MKYVLAILSFITIVMFILGWYAQRKRAESRRESGIGFLLPRGDCVADSFGGTRYRSCSMGNFMMYKLVGLAVVALPLALSGCGAVVTGISVAASVSTLLKNENNCTLITIADCQFPKLPVTQVVVAPEPPKVVVLSPPPVFVPMTMEPVPNPSRR